MIPFDFHTNQMTPEWLSSFLIEQGWLEKGKILHLQQEPIFSQSSILSTFTALHITYSAKSQGHLPKNILMKWNQAHFYEIGKKEIFFYEWLASTSKTLPFVTCYGTTTSDTTQQCFLLLEDVRRTHTPCMTPWPHPPSESQCKQAIQALAQIHAFWWNHELWQDPRIETQEQWSFQWIQQSVQHFPVFVDDLRDRLSTYEQQIYERIFASLSSLLQTSSPFEKRQTLVHGDAHFWNFLYPRSSHSSGLWIDWQLWRVGWAALDLAYMIALHWYPEVRGQRELPLLRFYLEELHKLQIEYSWEDFWEDYRIAVIFQLLYPLRMHKRGIPEMIWGPHLERGFASFEDHHCWEWLPLH